MRLDLSNLVTPFLGTLLLAAVSASPVIGQGTTIGFEEDFALAADRARALEALLPGTEEYYFHHCLHLQHEGRLAEVGPLLEIWIQRHGRTARVTEIENRQALLSYDPAGDRDPAGTFEHLRRRLDLSFAHQRQRGNDSLDMPTRLDPALISRATLTERALRNHPGTFDGVREGALERLVSTSLDDALLKSLLARLERPDVPGLAALVVRELEHQRSRGFGSLPIHGRLLLDQLEECARLRPALLGDANFIETWLLRLAPSADVGIESVSFIMK
jgi:hypothetical protein